jgi:leucyl aminopeptidase
MTLPFFVYTAPENGLPVWRVRKSNLPALYENLSPREAEWARAQKFDAAPGRVLLLPSMDGQLAGALLGLGEGEDMLVDGALASLPAGVWRFDGEIPARPELSLLAFALGAYRYTRYRSKNGNGVNENDRAQFVVPDTAAIAEIGHLAQVIWQVRDLINAPSEDMGPADLARAVRQAGEEFGARTHIIAGDNLLAENYPLVHAVGRASPRPPHLIDLRWNGAPEGPAVTLVGKGICFDTGGLDLKPESAMALMKKDMGGGANALGLAVMIMQAGLPIRLRLLIGAADNAVAGNAYRPGDVFISRKGLSVEIGNTDAEGRLVLADALAEADSESPDLLLCFATLTGAARTAMGPEIVPFYTESNELAEAMTTHAQNEADPLWRMPLWRPYEHWLESKVADLNNVAVRPFAGSIIAALFLRRFVERARHFAHFDLYAWNVEARPARPIGGDAQGIRALFALLKQWAAAGHPPWQSGQKRANA